MESKPTPPTLPAPVAPPPAPRHPIESHQDVVLIEGTPGCQAELFKALAGIQEKMSAIVVDKDGQVGKGHFKYATFPNIMRVARPALAEAGIFVTQAITSSPLGRSFQRITTMAIGHGARFSTALDYAPQSFLEDNPHGSLGQRLGVAWGYLRRMCLQNLLMLSPDKDDGEREEAPPSKKQATPKATPKAKAGRSSKPDAPAQRAAPTAQVAQPAVATPTVATVKVPNPASRVPASKGDPSFGGRPKPQPTVSEPKGYTTEELPSPVTNPQPQEEGGYEVQNPEPGPSPTPTPVPTDAEPEPEAETVPEDMTQPQRHTLRQLFKASGLKSRDDVDTYIEGVMGTQWKATNLDKKHAGLLINALKELVASRAALQGPEANNG